MSVGATTTGAFRGFVAFDEAARESFFGREEETARLLQLVLAEGTRAVVLAGESGVGKTSLLRAGLVPAIQKRGGLAVYLGSCADLDAEVLRATGRLSGDLAAPVHDAPEKPGDHLARIAHQSRGGTVLLLDHVEQVLTGDDATAAAVASLIARVAEAGGARLRLVLAIDAAVSARVPRLREAAGLGAAATAWMVLERLTQAQASDILERSALQSGTFFETGLSAAIAADLCRNRPCLPLDLQLVARAVVDLRLTTIRKFQRAGGAAMLPVALFQHVCAQAGGRAVRRILVEIARDGDASPVELAARAGLERDVLVTALGRLKAEGILRARTADGGERWALSHPGLAPHVDELTLEDRASAAAARRHLRRRVTQGQRLSLPERYAVKRHLAAGLSAEEQSIVTRSLRRTVVRIGIGAALALGILVFLFMGLRRSYTLGFEPAAGGSAARVVVRLGRSNVSLFKLLPTRPRLGAVIADTGFSAASLVSETAERIATGKATGTLDRVDDRVERNRPDRSGAGGARPVPGWLRDVLNGLRPVPRGVAKSLLGDPDGVTSLKHAFSDPLARRETLEALAVIGRGRAGEDEILAAALADSAPEIRRRGVEVAAAIDRMQGGGSRGATLRSALADKSLDVRAAVLSETATLPLAEAASILTVALRDPDPAFRRTAEVAAESLAERAPAVAAEAVQQVVQSSDGGVRRSGLALLERIATRAPAECAGALARVVSNEQAPEEARVAALLVLRKAGTPAPSLKAILERAVRPEASPRLRAAALPLYVRLIDPAAAEEIARSEMKGPPAARAAGAAVWGTVAISRPDVATTPLKSFLYDPSPEVRLEAARSFAYLKRDGVALAGKAIGDPNAEVERAAIESAVALAPVSPYQVAEMLGHAIKTVRPAVRRALIEALGRIGESRPAAVFPPLARTLKDPDPGTRAAVAAAFCGISKKNAAAASPYLRVAARDDHHEVRTAAASCLGNLGEGDPKGAAKIAVELAGAVEATVRTAAAEALGRLGANARDIALPALLKLVADPDRGVRIAAERAFAGAAAAAAGAARAGAIGFAESRRGSEGERALNAALMQGDAAERRVIVSVAAEVGLAAVLRQATADGDETVRLDAVRAAGALKPPALDIVRGAVDDRSNAVRAEATGILSSVSGAGAKEVLPIFESMLRGGDKSAREAAVIGVGNLPGAGEAGARLLGEALAQRSEALRTAAARALGRLAEREPDVALSYLERAARDSSYDVRNAAVPGLALAWSRKRSVADVADALATAEADSPRRFVALEALVIKAQQGTAPEKVAAKESLDRIAQTGPPLARLAAQIGRSFIAEKPAQMHRFIERLLGG
jgi:HEAT repeat protein/DNA-binding MarR family transcriptional regulator